MGEMLCHQWSLRDDVETVIALDKAPQSDFSKSLSKMVYIQMNMADDGWQELVRVHAPQVIIHTAWQIRAMYGKSEEQWRWNVGGSEKVFDFAFGESSVETLVYFSTAASYSARKDNSMQHYFTEEEGFRDDDYIYAKEKKVTEEMLARKYAEAVARGGRVPQVVVFRPAAVTGPRGRYMRMRFGLQSALQGNLTGSPVYRVVTALTKFVPATRGWVRQFIHEDDVNDAVMRCVTTPLASRYEVFNLTPPGTPVYAEDMAHAVGKRAMRIPGWMVRIAFWFFWHATRGKVPTCAGSWRFYAYPILMSGEKLARVYTCVYSSIDALQYTIGRYESYVPEHLRKTAIDKSELSA